MSRLTGWLALTAFAAMVLVLNFVIFEWIINDIGNAIRAIAEAMQ